MRRIEIIEGVEQIIEAINSSQISESLDKYLSSGENSRDVYNALTKSLQIFFLKSQSFSVAAQQISEIFKLQTLNDPRYWVNLLNNEKNARNLAYSLSLKINFVSGNLPPVAQLLNREFTHYNHRNNEPIFSNGKEMRLLSVTIFENDKRFSSPQRIINVLESINTFYDACAYIHDESPNTLSVVGCDSGSDKSFDFLGVAKVIECVVQLIEHVWDRVVFFKEKQFEARLNLIDKSLPVYDKINELEAGQKIEPELAERLRRNISEGVNKFIESGATIPEIDARSTFNSRSLLSPVQKLLVNAPEEVEEEVKQNVKIPAIEFLEQAVQEMEINNLSAPEQQKLAELLQKMKESPTVQNDELENSENVKDNS